MSTDTKLRVKEINEGEGDCGTWGMCGHPDSFGGSARKEEGKGWLLGKQSTLTTFLLKILFFSASRVSFFIFFTSRIFLRLRVV